MTRWKALQNSGQATRVVSCKRSVPPDREIWVLPAAASSEDPDVFEFFQLDIKRGGGAGTSIEITETQVMIGPRTRKLWWRVACPDYCPIAAKLFLQRTGYEIGQVYVTDLWMKGGRFPEMFLLLPRGVCAFVQKVEAGKFCACKSYNALLPYVALGVLETTD